MEIGDIFLLASERSEQDTIKGVQIRAGSKLDTKQNQSAPYLEGL